MKLNEDGTLAQINLSGEKSAAEIEEIIENLALLREHMTPAVPESKDNAGFLHMIDDPSVTAVRLKNGGIRLFARSPALGWIALDISKRNAPGLMSWMLANMDWIRELVEHSDSNGDAPIH